MHLLDEEEALQGRKAQEPGDRGDAYPLVSLVHEHTAPEARPAEHVRPHGRGWAVQREDEAEPWDVFPTKSRALQEAVERARSHGERLIVHRRNGSVEEVRRLY